MKNSITIALLFIGIIGCTGNHKDKGEPRPSKTWNLDGFWSLSSSEFIHDPEHHELCIDPEWFASLDPYALGTHVLIEGDSISLFRYPFEYYGTYNFRITGDSLYIKAGPIPTSIFALQKPTKNKLQLSFKEEYYPRCFLPAEATYENSSPDLNTINNLVRDSISYTPLAGKWWHLRKTINLEDGSDPLNLKFPKGMPDSIFISQKLINKDVRKPFVELKLNNKIVKMFIKEPYENSFMLEPALKKDKILFCDFVDYGEHGGIDTNFVEVIYRRND